MCTRRCEVIRIGDRDVAGQSRVIHAHFLHLLACDESILTTYVDVMSYESILENFETALKGKVFAMVYKVLHCRH